MKFLKQTGLVISILLASFALTAAAWYPTAYVPARDRLQKTVENMEIQGFGGPYSLYQRKDGSVLLVGKEVVPPADAVKKDSAWVRNVGLISVKQDAEYPVTEISGHGIWYAHSGMRVGYSENYPARLSAQSDRIKAEQSRDKLDKYMKALPRRGAMAPVYLYHTASDNCELIGSDAKPSAGAKRIDRCDVPDVGAVTLEQKEQQTDIVGYTSGGERVYGGGFITIYIIPRERKR